MNMVNDEVIEIDVDDVVKNCSDKQLMQIVLQASRRIEDYDNNITIIYALLERTYQDMSNGFIVCHTRAAMVIKLLETYRKAFDYLHSIKED